MKRRRHAEIAGAGFAGLAAATALAQRGWTVRVHERAAELRAFGAGIFIWENGLRVLRALGAYDTVVAHSHEAPLYQVRDSDDRLIGEISFGPAVGTRMLTMTRQTLYKALFEAAIAAGVDFKTRSEIVAATPDGTLLDANGTTYPADLVVGADGVHSKVRDSLGLLARRDTLGTGAIRLLVDTTEEDRRNHAALNVVTYVSSGSRRLLYTPCDAEQIYVAFTTAVEDASGRAIPLNKAAWSRSFPHLESLIGRVRVPGRWDVYEVIKLSRWSKGRVAVIGDAAHGMTPALGQGAGCAMMNGLSLAVFMERFSDIGHALEAWEAGERPLTESTQDLARRLTENPTTMFAAKGTKWTPEMTRTARHIPTGTA
jgi:2-polyprenyl-6-methoxyphenol hydroxylase-like FAD-dependent oxidoreductase